MSGPTYYGSGETTNLENQIGFDKHLQKIITGDSDDPSIVAKSGAAGSLYLRTNGLQYRKTDAGSSTNWELVNTGAVKDLDTLKVYCSDDDNSTWTTGNNATFLTAGSIAGVFTKQSNTTPIRGTYSYQYVAAAGTSINDWIASEAIALPTEFQARTIAISSQYLYNGLTNDIELKIYDVTSSVELETASRCYVEAASGVTTIVKTVFIPATCASIKFGFHVIAEPAASTVFRFDSNSVSRDPFVYTDLYDGWNQCDLAITGTSWTTTRAVGTPYKTGTGQWRMQFNVTGETASGSRTSYDISFTGVVFKNVAGNSQPITAWAEAASTQAYAMLNTSTVRVTHVTATTAFYGLSGDVELDSMPSFVTKQTATSEHVVTPASVKTEAISYTGYTNKDGSNFVKFATKDALRSNESKMLSLDNSTYTKYTMLQDGMYNAVATVPQASAAQTSIELRHYDLAGTLIRSATFLITHAISSQAALSGKAIKGDYFLVMSTFNIDGTYPEYVNFSITAIPTEANFLAAVPVEKVATLYANPATVASGSGDFTDITFDSVAGDTSIVTHVSGQANFILQLGEYVARVDGMCFQTDNCYFNLYNVTTSASVENGTLCNSSSSSGIITPAMCMFSKITLTSATTFKIRMFTVTSNASGLGNAGWSAYRAKLQIRKIK